MITKKFTSDFSNYEAKGLALLERVAKKFKKTFTEIKPTEYGCFFDALARNHTGGTYALELKTRDYKSEDCYIEVMKLEKLRDLWRFSKILPIYIVFYPDEAYMWVLTETNNPVYHANVVVTQKDGYTYETDRFGLSFDEAIHMDLDGNVLSVPENISGKKVPEYKDPSVMEGKITRQKIEKL